MDINSPGILDRFLDPIAECLTPEVAARIVKCRPSRRLQARVDELAVEDAVIAAWELQSGK